MLKTTTKRFSNRCHSLLKRFFGQTMFALLSSFILILRHVMRVPHIWFCSNQKEVVAQIVLMPWCLCHSICVSTGGKEKIHSGQVHLNCRFYILAASFITTFLNKKELGIGNMVFSYSKLTNYWYFFIKCWFSLVTNQKKILLKESRQRRW